MSAAEPYPHPYAVSGNDGPGRTAVLLIHGLGRQLIDWDDAFIARLVGAGYRVIRFDNRDVGMAPHHTEKLALAQLLQDFGAGKALDVPYRLADMANDAAAVLDHFEVDAAHVVGVSMGGYIAQELALNHGDRVLSLTSIMSSTGDRTVGQPTPEGMRALFRAPAPTKEAAVEDMLAAGRLIATPGEFDEARSRARIEAAIGRAYDPAGVGRQLAAIWASGDRTERLRSLDVPTLVVHGAVDPLVGPSGGEATAAAIPGAELLMVDGMGHDLPPSRWPAIVGAIVALFDRVDPSSAEPRIVPADPAHADALAALARRAFAADVARYGAGPPGMDDPDTHRSLLERAHGHELWVDGRLAGAAYVFADDAPGEWWVGSIFLEPDLHGRGLGRRLMEFVHASHPGNGCFTLETPYAGDRTRRFYEQLGYREIGSTEPGSHDGVTDPNFHLIIYRRGES